LANLGSVGDAAQEARRAVTLARDLGDTSAEVEALLWLGAAASYAGDHESALASMRQAQRIDPAGVPGVFVRGCAFALAGTLMETGEFEAARLECARELDLARQAGEDRAQAEALVLLAHLDLLAGQLAGAGVHLRDALQLLSRQAHTLTLPDCLDLCGQYCAQSHRWSEAITLWAACDAWLRDSGGPVPPQDVIRRQEHMNRARQAIGPGPVKAAEHRGTVMTLTTAAEFAALLVADSPAASQLPPRLGQLSPREQELVTLVAQGRTDAQIAAQLYISIRTVRSHLDRIRDKTGCRRRADLTRLALETGLV
jgi:DNA-binding CsgD family transcriptional regulator